MPILAGRLSVAADLLYSQTWAFQRLYLSDISASISLAPGEKLTLTIKKTQRTQLTENTMQSSDSLDSSESTIVDKDVLNVQRSSVHAQQWHVDGNANISIGGGAFTLGGNAGTSGSTQTTSNTVVEQISESTQKTARRLQTLQKIEVARQSELFTEEVQNRTIENPYRDRSLTLNVYELVKDYSVTTELGEIRPVIILEITDLELDREFMLSQGAFLDEAMLDRTLVAELREALQAVRTSVSTGARNQARRYARIAFHFLYEATNVFNLDGGNPAENDPWLSFSSDDGLNSASNDEGGRVFTTLGTYLRVQAAIYSQPPFSNPPLPPNPPIWPGPFRQGHDLEVDMAIALADSIRADWGALTPPAVEGLLDVGEMGEVMQRVSGFLSLVDGLLKPLLKPIEEEKAAAEARRHAEDVIDRVIQHINCNKAYYVQRFLDFIWRKTSGYALADVFTSVVRSGQISALQPNEIEELLVLFPPRLGFMDGFQFVVPLHFAISLSAGVQFIERITGPSSVQTPGGFATDTRDLRIPSDGFHIEPIGGVCILSDLPETDSSVTANINVEAREG